jgi:beta-galactosidase
MSLMAQRMQSFDLGWRFYRGDAINAEAMEYDDSEWREVIVPHDFSMEPVAYSHDYREKTPDWGNWQIGPFSRLSIGDWDSGQTVGGEGWYRKSFNLNIGSASLDEYLKSTRVNLRFEGVYNQAEVWVNGKKAAINVYGYMPFVVSLNEILKDKAYRNASDERKVTVAVKSINQGLNCRWYSGSGIYRHVWLEPTSVLHLDEWDTYIDASQMMGKNAQVKVNAKVFNETGSASDGIVKTEIVDADGKVVATASEAFNGSGSQNVAMQIALKSPKLWSVDSPYRYKARVSVQKGDTKCYEITIPFGVRTIEFSAEKGFLLNGKSVKLRGGCAHHDNGLLGAAAIDRAEVRKVELMKAQGYNAIRCSHNLPTVAFLNACDSLGMLVIDEVFDQWEEPKRKDDYSNDFSKEKKMIRDGKFVGIGMTNFEYDAALMVSRDRNNPSIIMWSIGN